MAPIPGSFWIEHLRRVRRLNSGVRPYRSALQKKRPAVMLAFFATSFSLRPSPAYMPFSGAAHSIGSTLVFTTLNGARRRCRAGHPCATWPLELPPSIGVEFSFAATAASMACAYARHISAFQISERTGENFGVRTILFAISPQEGCHDARPPCFRSHRRPDRPVQPPAADDHSQWRHGRSQQCVGCACPDRVDAGGGHLQRRPSPCSTRSANRSSEAAAARPR